MLTTDYAAFKTSLLADPTLTTAVANKDWPTIAAAYNAAASPQVLVWRPSVPVSDLNNAIDWTADATGFLSLTIAKQNAYFALTQGGTVDATQANIRNGFGAIFPAAITSALAAAAQVAATRFQALFTTGGVTSYFGYSVSGSDIATAMGW